MEAESFEPIYLHFQHKKFFEIKVDNSSNRTKSRCGPLRKDGTEGVGECETLEKPHESLNKAIKYMNDAVNKKLDKGYQFSIKKEISTNPMKTEILSESQDNFYLKPDMEKFGNIGKIKLSEETRSTQTILISDDDDDDNNNMIIENIPLSHNKIEEEGGEEEIDLTGVDLNIWRKIEAFNQSNDSYRNFYLTKQVCRNTQYYSLHIFEDNLVIEEGIEEREDNFPAVVRKFKCSEEAETNMKQLLIKRLKQQFTLDYERLEKRKKMQEFDDIEDIEDET